MARLSLSKSALHHQTRQLKTYQRFLPSLDLKRKQLIAERMKAREAIAATAAQLADLHQGIGEGMPMLADHHVGLDALVTLEKIELGEENLLGTRLPVLHQVQLQPRPYAMLARPHWVDRVQSQLMEAIELRLLIQVQQKRLERLEQAVQKITQRVNLFDKVLIPQTRENIRKIGIFLADNERAAVVRAKIAKSRRVSHT
jgi:V/A-type H+-transporting ATPase subunit D